MKWAVWHNVYPVSQHGVVRVSLAGHTFPRAGRPVAKLLSFLHVVEIATMSKALLTKSMVFMSEEPTASRIRYQPPCPFRDDRTWSGKFSWSGYLEHGPNMCTGASRAPTECGQSKSALTTPPGKLGMRVVMRGMSAEEASMRRLSSDMVAQHEACIKNVPPSDILKCNRGSSAA